MHSTVQEGCIRELVVWKSERLWLWEVRMQRFLGFFFFNFTFGFGILPTCCMFYTLFILYFSRSSWPFSPINISNLAESSYIFMCNCYLQIAVFLFYFMHCILESGPFCSTVYLNMQCVSTYDVAIGSNGPKNIPRFHGTLKYFICSHQWISFLTLRVLCSAAECCSHYIVTCVKKSARVIKSFRFLSLALSGFISFIYLYFF